MSSSRFLTRHAVPRPGLERACRAHRLGLGIPIGLRMTFQGAQCYYHRPNRRYQPLRRFHALGVRGVGRSYHDRAVLVRALWPTPTSARPCTCCGQLNPKGLAEDLCAICLDYMGRHGALLICPRVSSRGRASKRGRARYARPIRASWPMRLRDSRMRPAALRHDGRAIFVGLGPRKRSPHICGPVTMHYLARRRNLARRALARGFERIRAGLWYDRAGDVVYNQSSAGLEPLENVRLMRRAW